MVLHNVLVGDVWLCGGQSNMEFALRDSAHGAEAVKAADHPTLRLFKVSQQAAYAPANLSRRVMESLHPGNRRRLFGGRLLLLPASFQAEVKVPIGLV